LEDRLCASLAALRKLLEDQVSIVSIVMTAERAHAAWHSVKSGRELFKGNPILRKLMPEPYGKSSMGKDFLKTILELVPCTTTIFFF
jgi:hypothetical protein